jgi:hypothetical protein
MAQQQEQGQWVIANIYSGEIAPETARYADMDEAGQVLKDLVEQGRLNEGDYEVRPAPPTGATAPTYTPNDY